MQNQKLTSQELPIFKVSKGRRKKSAKGEMKIIFIALTITSSSSPKVITVTAVSVYMTPACSMIAGARGTFIDIYKQK